MPVVESPLALLQVHSEGCGGHAVELLKPAFSEAPEALNAVDMTLLVSKLIVTMTDSQVLAVTDINQSIVTAPAIRVDNGLGSDATANNGLQSDLFAVRHDLGVNLIVTLQESEDDGLTTSSATTFTAHPARTEVRFINFDFAILERRLAFALFADAAAYLAEDRDDRAMRKTCQLSRIGGAQIESKVAGEQAELSFSDSRTPIVAV